MFKELLIALVTPVWPKFSFFIKDKLNYYISVSKKVILKHFTTYLHVHTLLYTKTHIVSQHPYRTSTNLHIKIMWFGV